MWRREEGMWELQKKLPVDWGRRNAGRNREKEKDISMRAFCFRNRKKSCR